MTQYTYKLTADKTPPVVALSFTTTAELFT